MYHGMNAANTLYDEKMSWQIRYISVTFYRILVFSTSLTTIDMDGWQLRCLLPIVYSIDKQSTV